MALLASHAVRPYVPDMFAVDEATAEAIRRALNRTLPPFERKSLI
jgi:hypothetical protein